MRESVNSWLLLNLVTDRSLSQGRSLVEVVAEAVAGGVTCVQLREKTCSTRQFLDEALALKALLQPLRVSLIINDRVDIAMAVGADGVHLGQSDMPISHARHLLGPDCLIGISAESVQDALAAEQQGADYIGISPVFSTPTKTDTAPALGLNGIRQIRELVRIPLVGIGGINLTNARQVIAAGADGVAVVSAIMAAESPRQAAEVIRRELG
ncbi:thiamine-phosphate pyrophosphorylase [Trichlorobacter thiogenes]|uniref:Thiamine-phosphate synthase n=1 Tax=Trichlorobacter thiogenes TaxID=115783 RepID=A0A1T4KGR2_9BACT|nr:thiamine phosphate synthase [Trichlorobacter thiogenes]SJZ41610.1 thiamine-phosphate pyrophosphorylase [Trichlorobacter thiogenes]